MCKSCYFASCGYRFEQGAGADVYIVVTLRRGLTEQIDQYTLEARREVASRATEHADEVRMYNANKEEMDRRINLEREREAQMLASTFNFPIHLWSDASFPSSLRIPLPGLESHTDVQPSTPNEQ